MAHYAITYVYDKPAVQDEHRPAHRAYLASALEQGTLAVAGPLLKDEIATGALLIVRAETREAAQKFVHADPMYTGGAVLSHTVTEWNPVTGKVG